MGHSCCNNVTLSFIAEVLNVTSGWYREQNKLTGIDSVRGPACELVGVPPTTWGREATLTDCVVKSFRCCPYIASHGRDTDVNRFGAVPDVNPQFGTVYPQARAIAYHPWPVGNPLRLI